MRIAITRGAVRGTSHSGRLVERDGRVELVINGVVLEPDECEIYGLAIEQAPDEEVTALRAAGYCLPVKEAANSF